MESKKKIAILAYDLGGGGAERVISIIFNNKLPEYEYFLVLFKPTIDYKTDNINVTILESKYHLVSKLGILNFIFNLYKYYNFCRSKNIDLSISFLRRPNYLNCLIKVFKWKGKVFINERTSPITQLQHSSYIYKAISKFLIKNLYPLADKITTNSFGSANELNQLVDFKINVEIIENPIVVPDLSTSENMISINKNEFNFICVGRFEEGKNQNSIIWAFKNKLKDLNANLYFLGKGSLLEFSKKYVDELNLSNQIKFLGFSKNPFNYLRQCDCLVLFSDFEGFPNVILEGLASGLIVISSDCNSGPREILAPDTDPKYRIVDKIEYAKYGILTPVKREDLLAEAFLKVYNNFDIQSKYKKSSIQRSKDYDLELFLNKLRSQYES